MENHEQLCLQVQIRKVHVATMALKKCTPHTDDTNIYFKIHVLNFLQTRNRHIYMDSVWMHPIVYLMRCYLDYGQESILIRQDILCRLFNVDGRYLMQKTTQTYGNKYKNNSSISLSVCLFLLWCFLFFYRWRETSSLFFSSTNTPKHKLWDIIKTSEFMTFAERLFKLLNHVFNRFFATVWITNTRIYWNISIYPPKCQVNFLNRKGIG